MITSLITVSTFSGIQFHCETASVIPASDMWPTCDNILKVLYLLILYCYSIFVLFLCSLALVSIPHVVIKPGIKPMYVLVS